MLQSSKEGACTSGWGDQDGIWPGIWHTAGILGCFFANFRITFMLIVCLSQIPPPITSLAFWELIHLGLILFSSSLHLDLVPWFYAWPGYPFGLGPILCPAGCLVWERPKSQPVGLGDTARGLLCIQRRSGVTNINIFQCQAGNKCVKWVAVT